MTFLAEQCIAAVTGPIRHDFASFGEMADVLMFRVAWPCHIRLVWLQMRTDRMQSFHKIAVGPEHFEDLGTNARHNVHIRDDVG